jgi:DNA-binding NarL/FixJ family response regulator
MTKAIILHDLGISRESYKQLLENDKEIKVVGCAGNVKDIMTLCDTTLPDILIIDQGLIRTILNNSNVLIESADENAWTSDMKWTTNEQNILRLIAQGKTNREIASTIHLSEGRIKNIVSVIMKKLNFNCRTQLAVYAIKNNI